MTLRTIGVRLTAEIADYQRKMRGAGQSTRDLVSEMGKAAKSGHLDAVADRAGYVGLALSGMAGYAVKASMDFDKAMSGVSSATHGTAAEMGQLRKAALQAGKDTQYSATGAADAITELSKAGIATADILNGGLKGALALAAAGQMDVGEAAETAASAMTQFRLSGDKVPHVADLLAAAAGKAQGSVHDMGMALNQSGLVAAQFGLSIEDTTGVLAEFASAGLTGSDAGTSFKTMLLALANPSGVTKKKMDELGISFYDAQGKFIGLSGVAEVLRQRLGNLTEEQRNATLGQIFGNDAIRAAAILYKDGAKGVEDWKNKVNDAGYASDTAGRMTDNLAGDIERLKGSIETLAIQSGSGANSGLRVLVRGLESIVDAFGSLPPAAGSTITVLTGVSGIALLLGSGWVKLRKSTQAVRTELEALGPAGTKAAAGLSAAGRAATTAMGVFAAIQVVGFALNSLLGDELNPNVEALSIGLERFSKSGDISGESARVLGGNFGKLDKALKDIADTGMWSSFNRSVGGFLEGLTQTGDVMDYSLKKSGARLKAVDDVLSQLVSSGHGDQAAAIFKNVADRAAQQGVSVSELKKVLPGYTSALEVAGETATGTAGATGDLNSALKRGEDAQDKYATAADASAGAIRGERDALVALSKQMKAETDPVFGFVEAQDALTKAQKDAAKAIKEHGRNSEEAKTATRNLALAAIDLQGKAGTLSTTFDGHMTPALYATLNAAHLSKAEIKNLEKQFKDAKKAADDYDGDYKAAASAPGAKQAKTDLDKAYTAANHFAGPYRADISVSGYDSAIGKLNRLSVYQQALKSGKIPTGFNGPIKGPDGKYYAEGGWTGPGGKWDEAGIVHADEYVINKESRQKIEAKAPGLLDEMNETGYVPGYAVGGRVLPYPATASKTRIPSRAEVARVVGPPAGATDEWIVRTVQSHFPGLNWISKFRPGSMTLTGNRSYHSMHRAVDWPANHALAKWWHDTFMSRTKELITPWNELNIHNGAPHRYSGAVWRQHNFAGGNAHDHIAMKAGGTITEPIVGVGASGTTYSFGENYQAERVTPNFQSAQTAAGGATVYITNTYAAGANLVEAGRIQAEQLKAYLNAGGTVVMTNGTKVLP